MLSLLRQAISITGNFATSPDISFHVEFITHDYRCSSRQALTTAVSSLGMRRRAACGDVRGDQHKDSVLDSVQSGI